MNKTKIKLSRTGTSLIGQSLLWACVFSLALPLAVRAEEEQSNAAQSKVKVKQSTQAESDIDQEITNAKLRAESGSKSKVSLSFKGSYMGSSVNNPFGSTRMDIIRNNVDEPTKITGALSGRYRFDKSNSIAFGGGVVLKNPFNGAFSSRKNFGSNSGLDNPFVAYNNSFAGSSGTQNSVDFKATYFTDNSSTNFGHLADLDLSYSILKTPNSIPKLTLGLAFAATYSVFNSDAKQTQIYNTYKQSKSKDPTKYKPTNDISSIQENVGAAIYPFLEYSISDRYAFRTVFGYFNLGKPKSEPIYRGWGLGTPYQSLGLGIALTRDIYLYPNVQFIPVDLRAERTNVALSATINLL